MVHMPHDSDHWGPRLQVLQVLRVKPGPVLIGSCVHCISILLHHLHLVLLSNGGNSFAVQHLQAQCQGLKSVTLVSATEGEGGGPLLYHLTYPSSNCVEMPCLICPGKLML